MKKKTLSLPKEQVTTIVSDMRASWSGYNDLMQVMLEGMMRAEREEYKADNADSSNGYRPRKAFGGGKVMELRVPRTSYCNFYPIHYVNCTSVSG